METASFILVPIPAMKPGVFGPTRTMYQPDPVVINTNTGDVQYIDPVLVAKPNDTPTVLLGFADQPGSGSIQLGMHPWLSDQKQASNLYPVFEFDNGVIASLTFPVS